MTSACAPTESIALSVLIAVQLAKKQSGSIPKNALRFFLLAVLAAVCASIIAQRLQNLLLFNPFRNMQKCKGINSECEIFCHATETDFLSKTRFLFMLCTFFLYELISKLKMYLRFFPLLPHCSSPIPITSDI